MDQKYELGQRVKFITIKGSDPAIDRQINALAGRTGTIVKSYCVTRDEMPDLIKSFIYTDIYSYDIRFDDGKIIRGIPEAALEADTSKRR
jgi:hypothetical protein